MSQQDNLIRSLLSGAAQRTEDGGLFLPQERLLVQGVFSFNKRGEDPEFAPNLVVNEGLDYILKAAIAETSGIANWYIAPFSADVTVQATWTAAGFPAAATEWTAYTESARPSWTKALVASQGTDSFSDKAAFTADADAQTVRGAALVSASAKGATSGVLLAAIRFPSAKNLDTDEVLEIGYGLQMSAV